MRARAFTVLSALCLGLSLSGCGDEACKRGSVECLSESFLRACVPTADGADTEWLVHACGEGARCGMAPAGGADAGASASTAAPVAACIGTCETGLSECVSDTVARYCVDGRAWQLDPCQAGQRCIEGVCMFADGGIELCQPGSRSCGTPETEKICDEDGSKFIEQPCEESEQCLVDRCAPNPDASCDVESRCLDNKTSLRCLGEANGFEVIECEGDTFCEGGRCRGAVCAVGSVCSDDNQVIECVDGESLLHTQCGVNEACKQERDNARCVPKTCEPGVVRCGDPRDPAVDPTKFYTQCVAGPETASGLPEWVVGECTGLLTCDPARVMLGEACYQECTPGAQTCMADLLLGIADGFVECQDDGTWGAVEGCNAGGGLRLECAVKPSLDASVLPETLCAEPVCAYVITNQDAVGGACLAGELRACNEDGELLDPEPCEVGICRATDVTVRADGHLPGACDLEGECEDGEERCLVDNLVPTPLYQSCENGIWGAELHTCEDDALCLEYLDPTGARKKVCGADCAPGEKRCDISDQVQVCDDEGSWGDADNCDVGVCATIGDAPGRRDAACILECVPGAHVCTGAVVAAPDGVSTGTSQEAECGDDGLLGAPTDCPTDTVCRVSSTGEALGCVECIGPDVVGGNQFGYMDTRCDPSALEEVQECDADNTWAGGRACAAGRSCRMVNGDSCSQCSIGVSLMTCTETNLAALERCGPCSDPALGLSPLLTCRAISVSSLTGALETCESLFGDGPAPTAVSGVAGTTTWGGFTDCCDGATAAGTPGEFLVQHDCASRGYGAPTVAGGVSDCCSAFVTAGFGPAFAYCALP